MVTASSAETDSGSTGPPTPDSSRDDAALDHDEASTDTVMQSPSTKLPALIVLGLAVFLALVGIIGSVVASGSTPTYQQRTVTLPDGSKVTMTGAAIPLRGLIGNGEPPGDIIGNLGLPKESTVYGTISGDKGAAQFDRTARLTSPLAAQQIIDAFRTALPKTGWQVIYVGGAPQGSPGSKEVLAKRGSGDGFYWEAGVVVAPTAADGTTSFTIELLQLPDGG
jgi:hypothetical protein